MNSSAQIFRDSDGNISYVILRKAGKTVKVSYDEANGFVFDGARSILPNFVEMLKLIYPVEKEAAFNLPSPLPVTEVKGGVILFDNMEDLQKWQNGNVDNAYAYNGDQSLTVTSGPMYRQCGFNCLSKKTEMSFYWSKDSITSLWFGMNILRGNPGDAWYADIRCIEASGTWQFNNAGVYTKIPSSSLITLMDRAGAWGPWHFIKLIVDFEKHEYVSLQVNDYLWDMRALPMQRANNLNPDAFMVRLGQDGAAGDSWFDDVLVREVS